MHKHIDPYQRKSIFIRFGIILGLVIVTTNLIVISLLSYFPSQHYSITVVALNVTACIASAIGITRSVGMASMDKRSIITIFDIRDNRMVLGRLNSCIWTLCISFDEEQSLVVYLEIFLDHRICILVIASF